MASTILNNLPKCDKFWLTVNSNTICVGVSQSGKTTIIKSILKGKAPVCVVLFSVSHTFCACSAYFPEWTRVFPGTHLARVLLFYSVWQEAYNTFAPDGVAFEAHEGLPQDLEAIASVNGGGEGQTAVVLDDVVQASTKSEFVSKMLRIYAHHSRLCCFYAVQVGKTVAHV